MLGLNCHIYKDRLGEVTKVTAPNGKESLLYKEALRVLGDKEKALNVWSTAYSNGYADYLGLSPKQINLSQTDKNGEPLYRNIMAYLGDMIYVSGSYTADQVRELNNFIMASNLSSVEDIRNAIEDQFYNDGRLLINEYNLRASGLYKEDEINRIMNDPGTREEVESALSSLMEYLEEDISNRFYYLAEPVGEDVIYTDGYNMYGKRNIINPSDIDIALREQVGGIKDRSEFDRAMGGLSYPEVVDRYISDPAYAERIYNRYSALTRIPIMEIGGEGITPVGSRTAGILTLFARPGTDTDTLLENIDSINMIESDKWNKESEVKPILRQIEKAAAKMGIDVVGLTEMYDTKSQDEFDEFLTSLYIFTTELDTPNTDVDFIGFSEVYDTFFNQNKERVYVTALNDNLSDANLVYMTSALSKAELFDRYGLLVVPGYTNIYQRITKENIEDIYEAMYDAHWGLASETGVLPLKAFSPTAFSGSKFDQRKFDNPNNKEDIIRDMKRYIVSTISSNETEEMALYHIIYQHPAYQEESVDIQREYGVFTSTKEDIGFSDVADIRQWILNQKIYNYDLYNSGLKYININATGNISLVSDDPNILKSVDLALNNSQIREKFKQYAFNSNEPTLKNLFYVNDSTSDFQNISFRGWLYSRHPSLLPDFKGNSQRRTDGFVEADTYDDFIKVNNGIYGKVNERLSGSVYQRIGRSEQGILYPYADTVSLENNTGMPQEQAVAPGGASSMVRIDKTMSKYDPLNMMMEC